MDSSYFRIISRGFYILIYIPQSTYTSASLFNESWKVNKARRIRQVNGENPRAATAPWRVRGTVKEPGTETSLCPVSVPAVATPSLISLDTSLAHLSLELRKRKSVIWAAK